MRTQQKYKARRRIDTPGHRRELTFSTSARRPLLADPAMAELFLFTLGKASERHGFQLLAFVVMPDHVHLLGIPSVNPASDVASVSGFLSSLKRTVSYRAKATLTLRDPSLAASMMVQERESKRAFRFWQPGGGYDRNLVDEKAVSASVEYIHANPVRAGLVREACEYPWSSARQWRGDPVEPWMPRVDAL